MDDSDETKEDEKGIVRHRLSLIISATLLVERSDCLSLPVEKRKAPLETLITTQEYFSRFSGGFLVRSFLFALLQIGAH